MKISFFKSILFLVILLTYSCTKDDNCKDSDFVGSWLITEGCTLDSTGEIIDCVPVTYTPCENEPIDGEYYIFKSDGTYIYNSAICNGSGVYNCTNRYEGTWQLSGTVLTITETREYDCISDEFEEINEPSSLTVISCSDGKFVVKDESDPAEILQVTFTQQ